MAAGMKRMTAQKACERFGQSFEKPVMLDGFFGVFGTGRNKTAMRSEVRRNISLVNPNEADCYFFHFIIPARINRRSRTESNSFSFPMLDTTRTINA